MKFTAVICTLIAAVAVNASAVPAAEGIQARDTCGAGFGGDQRRTNSGCQASNGDRHFCGCDRTGVVCLTYPGSRHQTDHPLLMRVFSMNRLSAVVESGPRSVTVAVAPATVATTAALSAKLATASIPTDCWTLMVC